MKQALVISGLPASGKTTLGKQLALSLGFDFLDKDDFLERLFDAQGTGDLAWRQKLSRQSDLDFQEAANRCGSTVLVSHWRPPGTDGSSGTPTEWLTDTFQNVVEVFCDCPLTEAARRFATRSRHKGHGDGFQTDEEINARMANWAKGLPLRVGAMIRIDTTSPVRIPDVVAKLKRHLDLEAP